MQFLLSYCVRKLFLSHFNNWYGACDEEKTNKTLYIVFQNTWNVRAVAKLSSKHQMCHLSCLYNQEVFCFGLDWIIHHPKHDIPRNTKLSKTDFTYHWLTRWCQWTELGELGNSELGQNTDCVRKKTYNGIFIPKKKNLIRGQVSFYSF